MSVSRVRSKRSVTRPQHQHSSSMKYHLCFQGFQQITLWSSRSCGKIIFIHSQLNIYMLVTSTKCLLSQHQKNMFGWIIGNHSLAQFTLQKLTRAQCRICEFRCHDVWCHIFSLQYEYEIPKTGHLDPWFLKYLKYLINVTRIMLNIHEKGWSNKSNVFYNWNSYPNIFTHMFYGSHFEYIHNLFFQDPGRVLLLQCFLFFCENLFPLKCLMYVLFSQIYTCICNIMYVIYCICET